MSATNERQSLGGQKTAGLLLANLEGACECGDLATMDAAAEVIASRVRGSLSNLRDLWLRDGGGSDFVDWLLVAAPSLKEKLKKATGRDREAWLRLVG